MRVHVVNDFHICQFFASGTPVHARDPIIQPPVCEFRRVIGPIKDLKMGPMSEIMCQDVGITLLTMRPHDSVGWTKILGEVTIARSV